MTPEHAWFIVEGKSMQSASSAWTPDDNQARVRTAVEKWTMLSPQITPHHPILLATGARSRDVPLERTLFPPVQARSLVSGMQSFQIQLGASTQPGWERWLRAMGSMTPTQ